MVAPLRSAVGAASLREGIAGVQDDLQISLGRIVSQYGESRAKKPEKLNTESSKKDPMPYLEQTDSLIDKYRQFREARCSNASHGITQRVKLPNS